jgi:hypothetical protein
VEAYRRLYEIKTKDNEESWAALIRLCKVLNQTPPEELEQALSPILDIEGTLKFLALENVMVNSDGYWTRASDYSIYLDRNGQFHIIPYDANETFSSGGGPGFGPGGGGPPGFGGRGPGFAGPRMGRERGDGPPPQDGSVAGPGERPGVGGRGGFRGGPGGGGVELDPLVAVDDPSKPLLSKLLAVPELRQRYLGYVREIAERWLDWERLGPVALRYQALIAEDVQVDTRKLDSFEAFQSGVAGVEVTGTSENPIRGGGSLKSFADQRRAFLLKYSDVKATAK